MKKSEELKQKRTALEAKMAELTSKAERTAEDNSAFDQMARDIDALDLDIAREERIEKMAIPCGAAGDAAK